MVARSRNSVTALCALLAFTAGSGPASTEPSTNKLVHIVTEKEGDRTRVFVQNLEPTDVTATFELELTNLKSSAGGSTYTATYPGNELTEAFTLSPINPDKQWGYSYVNHFTIGSIHSVHDDSAVYVLPYEAGTECKVTQGYNGSYSHSGADQFAIDWKMACGTPVHAARAGVVAKVKVDSSSGGPDRKYENSANYILIRHSDGTLANYAHLSKNGAKVKAGDVVEAGDLIGFSGNTGFTSGPHLHFSVFKTKSGKERLSIPVKFQTAASGALTLVEGRTYKNMVAPRAVAQAGVRSPSVSAAPVSMPKSAQPVSAPAVGGVGGVGGKMREIKS